MEQYEQPAFPLRRHMQRQVQQMRRTSRHQLFQTRRTTAPLPTPPPSQLILDTRLTLQIKALYDAAVEGSQMLSYAEAMRSEDVLKMHYGVIGLRRLQSEDSKHPVQEFTMTNLVPKMVSLLGEKEWPQLQLEAARMAANLSQLAHLAELISEKKGVEMLLELLESEHVAIQIQAVCAIGNIGQGTVVLRDEVIRKGGVVRVSQLARKEMEMGGELFQHCCWALATLCNGTPAPRYPLIKWALPILCAGVRREVFKGWVAETDCLQILARDCKSSVDRIQILLSADLVAKLLGNLQSEHVSIVVFSLIILQHIAEGSSEQKDELISAGVVPYLAKMLDYPKMAVRREACAVLSSLAESEDPRHGEAVMGWEGLLPAIVHLISADACEVRAEVCYILMGLIRTGQPQRMKNMIEEYGLVRCCMDMVASELHETVEGAVRCLEVVLGVGREMKEEWVRMGGVEVLERLQYHRSNQVYRTVTRIMESNFVLDQL